jgi:hypothetical protein
MVMHKDIPFFFAFTVPAIFLALGLLLGGIGGLIEGRLRTTGSASLVFLGGGALAITGLFLNTKFHFWW